MVEMGTILEAKKMVSLKLFNKSFALTLNNNNKKSIPVEKAFPLERKSQILIWIFTV